MDLIATLKTKLDAMRVRLTELREARRPHALGAATGDQKARKAIEKIDADLASTASEAETLTVALEEAERQGREASAQAAQEAHLRRVAEANKLLKEIHDNSKTADDLMVALRQVLDKRDALISDLKRTGVVFYGAINALRRPLAVKAALFHAGVGTYLGVSVGFTPGPERRPLADASTVRAELVGREQTDYDDDEDAA